ncbi:helix-turn-helix domain-containing protein [Nocardia sp. NPDC051030]|uniref:helix-turn-helix domain-containing protein n=1 Tax=Nocardia sp. NPDC051030 TaxID=3155162 RepID=UPI003414DF3E
MSDCGEVSTSGAQRVTQAYRFALEPTAEQQAMLRSHCGAQRFAYNAGLARIRANLSQRHAEASYGIAEEQLTPPVGWSGYELRRWFNSVKDTLAPWWAENSKEAYSSGFAHLAAGLTNFRASKKGTAKAGRLVFPPSSTNTAGRASPSPPAQSVWWTPIPATSSCRGSE